MPDYVVFNHLKQKSVVDSVREQLIAMIRDGLLQPGMKLPSENTLKGQLGISRPSLREAIRMLEGEGLLEVRRGQGIFVREPSPASAIQSHVVSLLLSSGDFEEFLEIRAILEPALAQRAALKATAEQLAELESILGEMMDASRRGKPILDSAHKFHHTLAVVAGNDTMAKILDIIYEMIRNSVAQKAYQERANPALDVVEHQRLLEAIRLRDPDRAQHVMLEHIKAVYARLGEAYEDLSELADARSDSAVEA